MPSLILRRIKYCNSFTEQTFTVSLHWTGIVQVQETEEWANKARRTRGTEHRETMWLR